MPDEVLVGVGEELAVRLEDCVPVVVVPRDLLTQAVVALSDNVHLRSHAVQQTVRELARYVSG